VKGAQALGTIIGASMLEFEVFENRERGEVEDGNNELVEVKREPTSRGIGFKRCVVWCHVKGNKSHGTVIQQNWTTQNIYILFDWHFICSMDLKYSGIFSNGHFSTHAISDSLLALSLILLILISLFLSTSLPLTPHSVFACLCFISKDIDLNDRHHWLNALEQTLFLT
jgi:hypothetical protein